MVYVLKCRFFDKGPMTIFPHQRLTVFNIHGTYVDRKPKITVSDIFWPNDWEEWCIVPRQDVVRRARNKGYLNLRNIRMDEFMDRAFVGIYDSQIKGLQTFTVPLGEIDVLP